jgi:hypothetical protein
MNREDAIKKAQKLMAVAQDGRGNDNEAERALTQAEALMRKFGIEQAEIIAREAALDFDWISDFAPYSWTEYRVTRIPDWYQWIATSVGVYTDTIVRCHNKADLGLGVGFYGERSDVLFAVWLQTYLRDVVRRTVDRCGLGRAEKTDFRKAMVLRMCARLRTLRKERDAVFAEAKVGVGTALMVLSTKLAKRDAEFGAQTYGKSKKVEVRSGNAAEMGYEAGNTVGFNRPLSGGGFRGQLAA